MEENYFETVDKQESEFYEIRNSGNFGRYLIAKNDIPDRTLILQESSLIHAPSDDCDVCSENKEDTTAMLFCLGCCQKLRNKDWIPCTKCGWPLCSLSCKSEALHNENECGIFEENKASFPPPNTWPILYKSVIVLRIVLLVKEKQPSTWTDFFAKLEDHNDVRGTKDRCVNSDRMIFENMRYFFKSSKNLNRYEVLDETFLRRITGVLNVNAFCANKDIDGLLGGFRKAKCMFQKASLFAHSCAPNCTWKIDISPANSYVPVMKVFTAIPIKSQELITIPYNTRHLFYGTLKRQLLIESVAHFICKCSRCQDPTEHGSFVSALKCFSCRSEDGFLIPKNPLDNESRWVCTKKQCTNSESVEKIVLSISEVEDEFDLIQSAELPKDNELEKLYVLFDKHYFGHVLHPNHYVLQEISTRILELLVGDLSTASVKLIDLFLWHCEYLLRIADVILPGFNGYRDQLTDYHVEGLYYKGLKGNPEINLSAN